MHASHAHGLPCNHGGVLCIVRNADQGTGVFIHGMTRDRTLFSLCDGCSLKTLDGCFGGGEKVVASHTHHRAKYHEDESAGSALPYR